MKRWIRPIIYNICGVFLFSLALNAQAADKVLPFNLRVLDYDAKLDAVLLSGDFSNTLQKPIKALRAELVLEDTEQGETIKLFIEHQAKRAVWPQESGVWSTWMQMDASIAEHVFLKTAQLKRLRSVLYLRRVLYSDGSQQAFP